MSSSTLPPFVLAADFYDALAPMFDVMTDWSTRLAIEGPFLCAQLEAIGARRVLDFACGSGGHALCLAERGYGVTGVDVSPVMIRLARQKAQARDVAVAFEVIGPGEVPVMSEVAFDAVICLGNSLPHLLTQDELTAALRGMARVLRDDGVLILQNLNYDLRWVKQPRWFAAQGGELAGQPVLVWRFADYDVPAGRIYFHIALFRRVGVEWTVEVHTTPQRPLFQANLLAALAEASFARVQTFGRMALPAEPFDANCSGDLVVVARRSAQG